MLKLSFINIFLFFFPFSPGVHFYRPKVLEESKFNFLLFYVVLSILFQIVQIIVDMEPKKEKKKHL